MTEQSNTRPNRKLKRKSAVIAAGALSVASVAGATVLVQNFMEATVTSADACIDKVAGEDVAFDGFVFNAAGTTTNDGLTITEEQISIEGLRGDVVDATQVYLIQNNCAVDLDITLGQATQTGDWSDHYLEVWLGTVEDPTHYPSEWTGTAPLDDYDGTPLVFEDGGAASTGTIATGTFTLASNQSIAVGMHLTTAQGAAAAPGAIANWVVEAEYTP